MDESEFDKLRSVLPDGTISEDTIRNTYINARNSKDELLHRASNDIEKHSEHIKGYMTLLNNTGTLQAL